MNIVTKYGTSASGRGQVKATSGGKQKTIPWDHSKSREDNFTDAAVALIKAQGIAAAPVGAAYTYREKDHAHIFTVETV